MTGATRRPRVIYSNPSRAAAPRPEEPGRDRLWWYFMRLSGLLLVVLALGHMMIMHVHVPLSGRELDYAIVSDRWSSPFWRGYDLLLLVLALLHGTRGARTILRDYVTHPTARGLLLGLLVVVSAIWMVAGIAVILFFDAGSAPDVGPFS